jgi:hypothetical protein
MASIAALIVANLGQRNWLPLLEMRLNVGKRAKLLQILKKLGSPR